jgi:hypothetical protein
MGPTRTPQLQPLSGQPRAGWSCVALTLTLWLFGTPCSAQSFALPIDLSQGLVFGADQPRTPYLFDATLAPSLDLGLVRVGAVLGPTYRNPKWDLGLGGRLSIFAPLAARELGLRFVAQAEYLPREHGTRISAAIVAEAFGLIRVGLWPAYDLESKRAELTLSFGTDIMSWIGLLSQDNDHTMEDY